METDPVALIERVPAWAGRARVIGPLEGGITNHNFLVDVDGARFVLRIPGVDTHLLEIDRQVEREASERAARLGIAPEVVTAIEPEGCLVTRFVEGGPIAPASMAEPAVLASLAELLRNFHESGPLAGEFNGLTIPIRHLAVAAAHGVPIADTYQEVERLLSEIAAAFGRSPEPKRPCHNDLGNKNFLRDGERVWILDWEYAGMNDLFFDLANLSIMNELPSDAEVALIKAYFGQVTDRRVARLQLMKIVSDARESTWALVQQGTSTIAFDYPACARDHLDRLLANAAAPGYRGLLDAAAQSETDATETSA